jgi:hypothetical protein
MSKRQRQVETLSLYEAISTIDTPAGRKRLEEVLAREPFPHFRQHSTKCELLIRIDEDGTETVGRFAGRQFVESQDLTTTSHLD